MTSSTVYVSAEETVLWHSCHALPPHWVSLLDQPLLCETAMLTFTSPPPPLSLSISARSAQVCSIMRAEAEACMCEWGCILLHLLPISIAGVLCSASLCGGLVSAAGAVTTVASSSASFAHPHLHTRKHPFLRSIPALSHISSLSDFFPPASLCRTRRQARQSHSGLIYPPASPSSPSAQLGLPLQLSPSPVLFTVIRSQKSRSGKGRQAVSSSCKSVCWLGSWSSTVPLEDDPVDEDRRDGLGGAAWETEDSRPKHRWVTTRWSTPTRVPSHCIVDCRGLCMFVWNVDIGGIIFYCISCLVRFRPNWCWKL